MSRYMKRFLAGEHEAVWLELAQLDLTTSTRASYDDVFNVIRETMRRISTNIEVLVQRLVALGYQFGYAALEPAQCFFIEDQLTPPLPWSAPGVDIGHRLTFFEEWCGSLPLALRAWYETVGSVNLVGALPGGPFSVPLTFSHPDSEPLPVSSDPLWIYPFPSLPELMDQRDEWQQPITQLELAPDKYFKVGQAGGGSLYVAWPPDATLRPDCVISGDTQRMSFVSYLRTSLRCGGFPGLAERYGVTPEQIVALTTGLEEF